MHTSFPGKYNIFEIAAAGVLLSKNLLKGIVNLTKAGNSFFMNVKAKLVDSFCLVDNEDIDNNDIIRTMMMMIIIIYNSNNNDNNNDDDYESNLCSAVRQR